MYLTSIEFSRSILDSHSDLVLFEQITEFVIRRENSPLLVMNRRVYNFKILLLLFRIFVKYPDLRFGQALLNANFNKEYFFNEEPSITYLRIKEWWDSMQEN